MKKLLLLSITSVFFLAANAIHASDTLYECRPDEVINTNSGETINKITDKKTALHLTVSKNKIFDGTYNYNFKQSKKYTQGIVQIYNDPQSGNLILFPTFLIEENRELDIYHVLFQYSDKPVGLYFNCFNFKQIKAYRTRHNK